MNFEKTFNKKVFSLKSFAGDLIFLFSNFSSLIRLNKNAQITNIFREKIMTVVSSINGCTYCKWFHARQAVKAGIPAADVKKLFEQQFDTTATDFELSGLMYAQHYAETNRNPNIEMTNKLVEDYGKHDADAIQLTIRMIFFGNLYGNTLDAFISRINGIKAQNSSFMFEFLFFFINIPIFVFLKLASKT
jgi:AhpD family alkylhydroperoxidase